MIFGIGTDIVETLRIQTLLQRFGARFWQRILTATEQAVFLQKNAAAQVGFLAKRYAAKEAVSKALGTGIAQGISFQHIEITNNAAGKPLVHLSQQAKAFADQAQITHIHLSLSDEKSMIVAFVVCEKS